MRTRMSNARRSILPSIPETLGDVARQYEGRPNDALPAIPGQAIFRGGFRDTDDNWGLIFMSQHSLDLLSVARELHIDGTFKVVPRQPYASQLLTIHIKYMNTVSIDKFSSSLKII